MSGIEIVISIVLVLFFLLFDCYVFFRILSIFSRTIREFFRNHHLLDAAGATVTWLLLLLSVLGDRGHGSPKSLRKLSTMNLLSQVFTAVINYEMEYGHPPTGDNPAWTRELAGSNPKKIAFISFSSWELDSTGEMIDRWGTPLRISLVDPKHPVVQSAGPDKIWNTKDDLTND